MRYVLTFQPNTASYSAHAEGCRAAASVTRGARNVILIEPEKFATVADAKAWADADESAKAGEKVRAKFKACPCTRGQIVKKNPTKRTKRAPLKFSGVEFKPGNAEAFVAYHSPAWDTLVESGWVTHSVQSPDANGVRLAHMLLDRKAKRAKNPAPKKRAKKKMARKRNPVSGYVIHAQRGSGPLMFYRGEKFTNNGRPTVFATQKEAVHAAREILAAHPVMRPYRVTVEPYSPK